MAHDVNFKHNGESGSRVVLVHYWHIRRRGGEHVLEVLAGTIKRLLNSRALHEGLRAKGLERAKQFTWEDSTKHVDLYRRLLGLNR